MKTRRCHAQIYDDVVFSRYRGDYFGEIHFWDSGKQDGPSPYLADSYFPLCNRGSTKKGLTSLVITNCL